jgi:hypothetical protein
MYIPEPFGGKSSLVEISGTRRRVFWVPCDQSLDIASMLCYFQRKSAIFIHVYTWILWSRSTLVQVFAYRDKQLGHFQEHRGGNFIAQFIIELLPPAVQQCVCLTSRRTWLWTCWNKCLVDEMQDIWHQEVMYIALELCCWRCWQGEGRWTRIGQVENRTW